MCAPAGVLRTTMDEVIICAAVCRGSDASSGCSSTTALLRFSSSSVCVCAPAAEAMGTMMVSSKILQALSRSGCLLATIYISTVC